MKALPRVVAQRVAQEAATQLTALARAGFDAQKNPYGAAWAGDFDLVETGKLRRDVRYVAKGTKVIARLGSRYARYHATKVLPGRALPSAWVAEIDRITAEELERASK
jgi:hypothetical protein